MNQRLQIIFPGKLIFGSGTLPQLADDVVAIKPSKVFIATIEPLKNSLTDFIASLQKNNIKVVTDTSIVAEPSFSDFEKLMQVVTPFNPDVVIGIGGGSVLDIAKLVAAQLENEQQLKEYVGIGLLKGRKKNWSVCLPPAAPAAKCLPMPYWWMKRIRRKEL